MKLTKKPAVKLSGNTPITYLLSSLCICTVCKCQELDLSKAPVLLTTLNNLWSAMSGLFICKIVDNFVVLYLSS